MKNQAFETIELTAATDVIGQITLNRPEAANALNTQMGQELSEAFSNWQNYLPNARVLILTGRGDRAFCAGADLKERRGMDKRAWEKQHQAFESALAALGDVPVPVIAAVNGAAVAGGLELALACDFIVAAGHAIFAFTEATLGIMPGLGGTQRLPRAIGSRKAKQMLFTGKPITSAQAREWGLVNEVANREYVLGETLAIAELIAANAPLAIRAIKSALQRGTETNLAEGLDIEMQHYSSLIDTEDRMEGINAFNEKRKPVFKGQ